MKVNNIDRLYLLSEVFGNDVSQHTKKRNLQIREHPAYKNVDQYMWMVRINPTTDEDLSKSYLNLDYQSKSYFQALSLEADVVTIVDKSMSKLYFNPFIKNPIRPYPIKTIGEVQIEYDNVTTTLNDYLIRPDIATEDKIHYVSNIIENWCKEISNDIQKGLEANRIFAHKVSKAKSVKQPILTVMWLLSFLILVGGLALLFIGDGGDAIINLKGLRSFSNLKLFDYIYLGGLLTATLTFVFGATLKSYARFFRRKNLIRIEENSEKYRASLRSLVSKNAELQSNLTNSVQYNTPLSAVIGDYAVLNPDNYAYDKMSRNINTVSKRTFARKYKPGRLLFTIFFFLTLALGAVASLITLGVINL